MYEVVCVCVCTGMCVCMCGGVGGWGISMFVCACVCVFSFMLATPNTLLDQTNSTLHLLDYFVYWSRSFLTRTVSTLTSFSKHILQI